MQFISFILFQLPVICHFPEKGMGHVATSPCTKRRTNRCL